ncbi:unnamed protein product [Oreochromis niloticus]|nr:unnamed protein product [Mustela putorius furo]
MAAGTNTGLLSALLLVKVIVLVFADQKNITAESGQDITLTCRAPNNNIIVVEWSRADLGDKNVFLYRNGQFESDDQHPSFKDRVDLQDRQMKDGDVSLILKDLMINDTGTYQCQVIQEQKEGLKLISIIYLSVVDPPGQPRGSVGLIVGLIVLALLLVAAVVGYMFYNKRKEQQKQDSYQPANELQPS